MTIIRIFAALGLCVITGCSAPIHEPKASQLNIPRYAVEVTWEPVTQNTDNETINDVAGYLVRWGQKSGTYEGVKFVAGSSVSSAVLEGLAEGQYYFAVAAVTDGGVESEMSDEMQMDVGPEVSQ